VAEILVVAEGVALIDVVALGVRETVADGVALTVALTVAEGVALMEGVALTD